MFLRKLITSVFDMRETTHDGYEAILWHLDPNSANILVQYSPEHGLIPVFIDWGWSAKITVHHGTIEAIEMACPGGDPSQDPQYQFFDQLQYLVWERLTFIM